jgi:hypothetical protein
MITVVDHVSPWFTPRNPLATTIHVQDGAHMSRSGTGSPASHPATSTGFLPNRSDKAPATKFVTAFTSPNATRNVRADAAASRPKTRSARSGNTVRSWPTMPPTSAFTPTRIKNCGRFALKPSRVEQLTWVTGPSSPSPSGGSATR